LYVISPLLVRHARRVYAGRFVTLPNLVLDREIVPELLQDDATPQRLADTMDGVLHDPSPQYRELQALREALGPADALDRCAAYAVELARSAS
jgi:lipid-A-disaccharide synthase